MASAAQPESTAEASVDWTRVAARGRVRRRTRAAGAYAFLIAASLPIILPYFWLVTVAFSAKLGIAETSVLWRSMAVLVPTVILFWLAGALSAGRRQRLMGFAAIAAVSGLAFTSLVGPDLHLRNFIFLVEPNFESAVLSRGAQVTATTQYPSVWHAFGNSLLLAGSQTVIVVVVAS